MLQRNCEKVEVIFGLNMLELASILQGRPSSFATSLCANKPSEPIKPLSTASRQHDKHLLTLTFAPESTRSIWNRLRSARCSLACCCLLC